jgi:arginyl-tRNA synthetase
MSSVQKQLGKIVRDVFCELNFDPTFASLKFSDRPDLSDYQCNGALPIAKQQGVPPQQVAENIIKALQPACPQADLFVAGPGFINFKLKDNFVQEALEKVALKPELPVSKHVFLDYGGPNVAKPLHVGHLRSSIIGESLKRLFRYMGHKVTGDIHLGDWGTQMGMLIVALQEKFPNLPYFQKDFSGPYPGESPVTLKNLEDLYPKISARCKEDKELADRARLATMELQQGRAGYKALWQCFVDVSVEDLRSQLERLGVTFEQWFGESRYQEKIPALLEKVDSQGISRTSDGALIIDVAEEGDKTDIPPLLLQKSDGGFLYATTDLATIEERVDHFGAEAIIYVVDGRQSLHFEQVFRVARKMGYRVPMELIGFGTMNGPDGKPFKTREGGVMRLEELIDLLVTGARQKLEDVGGGKDLTFDEEEEIAFKVGIAALKFADLQHNPMQNYQFDVNKFLSFEGKTGPYLLYVVVRIKAILSKGRALEFGGVVPALQKQERDLAICLLRFADLIELAYEKRLPNILCEAAFELAQIFNRFYQSSPILIELDEKVKSFRLFLCEKTLQQMLILFELLGIEPVERM